MERAAVYSGFFYRLVGAEIREEKHMHQKGINKAHRAFKGTFAGSTPHYSITYDPSIVNGLALATSVLGSCESDYTALSQMFGGIDVMILPIPLVVGNGPADAANSGGNIVVLAGDGSDPALLNFLNVAELAELFEYAIANGWDPGGSNGEGISRVLAAWRYPTEINTSQASFSVASTWLEARFPQSQDFVSINGTDGRDGDLIAAGCAVLFINYLRWQLGFQLNSIVLAGGATLDACFSALTNQGRDSAFAVFEALISRHYSRGTSWSLIDDNPFPLPDGRLLQELKLDVYKGLWAISEWSPSIDIGRNARTYDKASNKWESTDFGVLTGNPALILWSGHISVFGVSAKNEVLHIFGESPQMAWEWSVISDAQQSPFYGGVAAFRTGSDFFLYVRNSAGFLFELATTTPEIHHWTGTPLYSSLNGQGGTIGGDPEVLGSPDNLYVIARSQDPTTANNLVIYSKQISTGAWSFADITTMSNGTKIAGNTSSIFLTAGNEIRVYSRGEQYNIVEARIPSGAAGGAPIFSDISTGLISGGAFGTPNVVTDMAQNNIFVFFLQDDQSLVVLTTSVATNTWRSVNLSWPFSIATDPTAICIAVPGLNSSEKLFVYAGASASSGVVEFSGDTTLVNWADTAILVDDTPVTGRPIPVETRPGVLELFVTST